MGEVYKATDTRLDRTVAIKVLPEHVAADPDLKQRFEREARTVAGLNHHGIGNQDGIDFLVMEYLDGEALAQLESIFGECRLKTASREDVPRPTGSGRGDGWSQTSSART